MLDFLLLLKTTTPQKESNVFLGLSKRNLIFKEITQLNLQNELQYVSRFAIGISSLWEREGCYINRGLKGQEPLKAASVLVNHLVLKSIPLSCGAT